MKVLLDECVDWRLAREISGHEVRTARQMGWTAIRNGELLELAAKEFEAFITADQNLTFQQDLLSLPITVVVLGPKTSRLADLKPLVSNLRKVLQLAQPRQVYFVDPDP